MICALFCCYFGCASWYVPFLVLISTAPHDICPFWFLFRLRFMICAPFLFLFRLRLMICALFVSYFSCASWYVPFFCSYFGCTSWYVPLSFSYYGCASWYVPFLVLISAAPYDMFLFFVLISAAPHDMCPFLFLFRLHLIICVFFSFLLHPNVICDLLLRTHGDMGCMCLTEWIQSSSQIEANYWPPQFLVPRALWVKQPATEANASYLISKSHLRKKDLFFCPSRQRWYICNKKDKGSTYWCRWLNFKGKCSSS